jgi:CheY-like chemotaxis protein
MNLTFGVCWIEDQASDAEIQSVCEAIRGAGFEPEISRVQEPDQIREFSARQQHFHTYELILLDLRLGDGLRGDELAPQVRGSFRSTPILFYSAEDETVLRQMMARRLIEGAYCSHRDRLALRVGELVSHLSPALNRLSGMRGLSTRVVAECDGELRSIITHVAEQNGSHVALLETIKRRIDAASTEQAARVAQLDKLADILLDHAASSGVLYNVVKEITGGNDVNDNVREVRRELRNLYRPSGICSGYAANAYAAAGVFMSSA